jgi:glycosyltransferase involved in cell wall biosynthesis
MLKICVIMGGVMPVPAVCGGAIETLVTSIVKKYSRADGLDLTVCSVFHPEAVKVAKQYPEVRFFWTHTRSIKYLLMHAVFLGVRMITGKSIRPLQRHYNEIAQLFKKEHFDLIIAEGGDTQAIADIAEGYRREQFVNHIHIHYLPPENIAENYGHVIGVSEFVTNEYIKACKTPVKAYTLKNAIDTAKFTKKVADDERNGIRKALGFEKQDFVILYVGRIIKVKGVLELMEAVVGLEDKHIKLMIMGSANSGKWTFSSYEKKVKRLSGKHKDRIRFTGYVDNSEVYKYAAAADIQCVPSLWEEAAGLVILEAMAEGLPLIVTKSGGVTEYVDDSTALIIEKENVTENLKRAILYMKENPEVRRQMSENGKIQSRKYDEQVYYTDFVKTVYEIEQDNREN